MVDVFALNRFGAFYMKQYPGLTIHTMYNPIGEYINYHIDNFKAGSIDLQKGTFAAFSTDEAISKLNYVIIDFLARSTPCKYEEAKK